jgi:hypothetical protein
MQQTYKHTSKNSEMRFLKFSYMVMYGFIIIKKENIIKFNNEIKQS